MQRWWRNRRNIHTAYKTYISKEREDIGSRDLIHAMLAKGKIEAGEKYLSFVGNAKGIKNNSPLNKVYSGVIPGGEEFIKETLKKFPFSKNLPLRNHCTTEEM